MNKRRYKFRYYSLTGMLKYILNLSDSLPEVLVEENVYLLTDDKVKIPQMYWREGTFFLPEYRVGKRGHIADYCEYKALTYYNGKWYLHNDTEDSIIDFHQPTKKIWETLNNIPIQYLNKQGLALLTYWRRFIQLTTLRRKTRLSMHRILKRNEK
jgi:hypothetical protein